MKFALGENSLYFNILIICRYKESKEIEAGLKELKIAIANPSCDNEVLRDYFLKLIRKFVFSALDEIYSFKTEKEILAHMAQMREQSGGACAAVAVQRPKIRYVYYNCKYPKKSYQHLMIFCMFSYAWNSVLSYIPSKILLLI